LLALDDATDPVELDEDEEVDADPATIESPAHRKVGNIGRLGMRVISNQYHHQIMVTIVMVVAW
jgi:hypothetical protein